MTQEAEKELIGVLARIMHAVESIAKKQDSKFEPLGKPQSAAALRRSHAE